MGDLTYKQLLFVEAYLGEADGNASEAARIAGYGSPGTRGHELVKKREIAARISQRVASAAMTANEVLARLSEQASATLGDFIDVNESGSWNINLRRAKRSGRIRLLKKVKKSKDGTETEIEIRDPHPPLVKLGEYHGLFKQHLDVTSKGESVAVLSRIVVVEDNRRPVKPPVGAGSSTDPIPGGAAT